MCGDVYENAVAPEASPPPRASQASVPPFTSQPDPARPEGEVEEQRGGGEEEDDEEYDEDGHQYVFSVDIRRRLVAALRDLMESFQILEISHRREFGVSSSAKGDSAVGAILRLASMSLTSR